MTEYEFYLVFLAFMFGTLFGLCISYQIVATCEKEDCLEEKTNKTCSRCGQHKEI